MKHRAERLYQRKWGIFTHYLYHEQNKEGSPTNTVGYQTDWNECVDSFDVEKYAAQVAKTGAGYVIFTIMQGRRFMCAPNDTFNQISGYQPGEGCSHRDLIMDLSDALRKYDIDLFLYFTGDGPHFDEIASKKFGFNQKDKNLTMDFVKKWASVLREYAVRYGDRVTGWWMDGCLGVVDAQGYQGFGYTDELLAEYKKAILEGNPDAIVAFNNGVGEKIPFFTELDDYTAGEMADFCEIPDERFLRGVQWHILAPLGLVPEGTPWWNGWCKKGAKHDGKFMDTYVKTVNEKGGVVSIDIFLYRDGGFDPVQLEVLKEISVNCREN